MEDVVLEEAAGGVEAGGPVHVHTQNSAPALCVDVCVCLRG